MENKLRENYYFYGKKLMYIIFTVTFAVLLPQVLHGIGILTGTNAALGQIFLPMHIPVLVLGFCVGPWAGLAAGIAAPLFSGLLTGMPSWVIMPFITAEISAYGFFAGLLKDANQNLAAKVIIVQILGRIIRILPSMVLAAAGNTAVLSTAAAGMLSGIPGIILQIVVVPCIVNLMKRAE